MASSYYVAKNDIFLGERVHSTDLTVKYSFAC